MAGVRGMAFTTSGLPSSANKEKGGFCWQDAAEAGSTDFFDQYVELGDSDAESASGGGGGFGQFGVSGLSDSPHLSFGQMLPPTGGGHQGPGTQGHVSAVNINHGSSSSNSNSNNAASSSSAARIYRPRPQLHPLYRASTNMTAFSNPETEADGMSYGSFGEAPGGGSISDSELLKLEGLRMGSPRIQIPQFSASEPASPPSKATSPRKASRLGNLCTKIRNKAATLQGKKVEVKSEPEPLTSPSVPVMSTAQLEPAKSSGWQRPENLQVSKSQLPSPPLTSGMPNEAQRSVAGREASFVNGFLDDPFNHDLLNGQFIPPLQLNGTTMPQTPMSTPLMNGWQLPMTTTDGKTLWTAPATYFGNGDANTWWDPSPDAMDTDPLPLSYHAAAANARNTSLNLAIQLQHQQSFEYPAPPGTEDTTTATFNPNGLMLHMPQPRGIPSTVPHSDNHRPTRADHHRRPKPRAPSSGARHHQYGPGMSPRKGRTVSGGGGNGSTSTSRIASVSPSPKIPAAAAGPAPGPNGNGRLHRRSASMQTLGQAAGGDPSTAIRKRKSWTGRRTSSSSSSLHHQYHTLAVAAAADPSASPARRRTSGNNNNTSPSSRPVSLTSTSFPASHPHAHPHPHNHPHPHPHPHNPIHPQPHPYPTHNHTPGSPPPATTTTTTTTKTPSSTPQNTDGGFVNYTPQDRTLLMTGVAPSGSSKTKARREREEAERQREFQARLARMVQAAGGDVSKLGMGGGMGVGGVNGVGGLK
ncbi:uncharacterized protein B0H64DRAFT_438387 [Chaetomium fimeti]|uniref:Developmental regulatory protein wetA n=1 Tax=Chaetomium fimeti TaxID=1854472 RepID=A0AAE0HRY6_9PEZI|nr:hypothetical protein B0H64DRAFT_438387 [Chaetomium fimeti]